MDVDVWAQSLHEELIQTMTHMVGLLHAWDASETSGTAIVEHSLLVFKAIDTLLAWAVTLHVSCQTIRRLRHARRALQMCVNENASERNIDVKVMITYMKATICQTTHAGILKWREARYYQTSNPVYSPAEDEFMRVYQHDTQ